MSNMAQWGSQVFLLSPTKIMLMENLSTSVELKSDSENDTSGTSPTNTRGLVAQPISFSATYTRAAGVDPRTKLEEWQSLVGKSNPLYIGGKIFGPASLILKKVDASNFVFSPKGDFLSVTVNLSFVEHSDGQTSKAAKTTKTTKSTKKKSTKAGSVYVDTVEKRKAMNATASANDRNTKKLSVKERRLDS